MAKSKEGRSFDKYVHDNTKTITIDFDKIFQQPYISSMNELVLKKRSYYSSSDLITNSIKLVFNSCTNDEEEASTILAYLNIVVNIKDLDNDYPFKTFKKDIKNLITDPHIQSSIYKYIDDNYEDEMDAKTEKTKETKKINQELQFTDEHVRILLKSAEAVRFVIPLVTDYCDKRDYDISDGLYDVFYMIIKTYQNDIEIMNKIHRFVYSRVVSTQYSDRVIWNVLCNKSKDINTITLEFLKDILIGILTKTILGKNVINLFHVVIRNKLGFEFSKNYKISFKPVNLNQVDSEGLTPFDKWEISMSKKNESKIVNNNLSIEQQIKHLKKAFGITVTRDEFNYYHERIKINRFQTNLLFLFFAKYMGSYQSLYNCNRKQYTMMIIIFYKWLINNGFQYLPVYILATPDKLSEKRMNVNKSKIYEQVTESKTYKELLKTKFTFIETNLNESNTIVKMIGNLNVSKFNEVVPYQQYVNLEIPEGEELDPEPVDIKIEFIADEILNFLRNI
jgi:hypothetical protein